MVKDKKNIRSIMDSDISVRSLSSFGSNSINRESDTFEFRIEFIKELLENAKLEPLINTDINFNNDETNSNNSTDDIRHVLNKKMFDFYKIINQIGGKLLYIRSGSSGHTFKGIVPLENNQIANYAVKVVAYSKRDKEYGDMNDIKRPENAELLMIKLLSEFVINKQSPHIVLPVGIFNTSIKPFVNLVKDDMIHEKHVNYFKFVEKYNKGDYYDEVSILISEWANRGDLLDFIRLRYKEFTLMHWKVFFFQIISVLAVIQSKYPEFRHNDFKANNILVQKITQNKGTLFSYTVNRQKYQIPNIGYRIKIWDFDFACIPGIVDNAKVSSTWANNTCNVKPEKNRYYDMHYFFNTLIKKGFFPQFMETEIRCPEHSDNINITCVSKGDQLNRQPIACMKCNSESGYVPREAQDFVNRVVPPNFQSGIYVSDKGRLLVNYELMTPDTILRTDPFFKEFRVKHKKK